MLRFNAGDARGAGDVADLLAVVKQLVATPGQLRQVVRQSRARAETFATWPYVRMRAMTSWPM